MLLLGGNLFIWRNYRATIALCVLILLAPAGRFVAQGQTRGLGTLEGVFRQMDSEAKDFHSLSADIERTKVTVVVNDHSTETGSIQVRGDKMLLDMKVPDPRTILRTGDSLYVYTPGLKRVEEYNLGKNRTLVDQFLLVGFGTDSKEMQ
jgi:outer membrane lipoprotein-sorting protein